MKSKWAWVIDSPFKASRATPKRSQCNRFFFTKESNLGASAGIGLFVKKYEIRYAEFIGEYTGKIITHADACKQKASKRVYHFDLPTKDGGKRMVLDGSDKDYASFLRYVNEPRSKKQENAEYCEFNGKVYLQAM